MAKIRITITVDPALVRRVERAAKKIGSNRSAFFESAAREAISDAEGVASILGDDVARAAFLTALAQPGVVQSIGRSMGEQMTQDQVQQMLGYIDSKAGSPKSKRSAQ